MRKVAVVVLGMLLITSLGCEKKAAAPRPQGKR